MKYNQDQLRKAAKHLTIEERIQWIVDAKMCRLAVKRAVSSEPISWVSSSFTSNPSIFKLMNLPTEAANVNV